MRYYEVQQAMEGLLLPKSIDFTDSHIITETIIKLVDIKYPELVIFGTKSSESRVNINIGYISEADAQDINHFLTTTCGEVNESQDPTVTTAYDFDFDAGSFHSHLWPLIKSEIEKMSADQIGEYQRRSENSKAVKDYIKHHRSLGQAISDFFKPSADSKHGNNLQPPSSNGPGV